MCTDETPEELRFNAETEAAIQETCDIIGGKIKAKTYTDIDEMFRDILAEDDEETSEPSPANKA